ncbi:NUDIX hydrolase [Peptoniphilus stercorisuis]|uniref:ADP-ribose pyrophosphatase n=1 Tax=Peptoniphilus stercorisuis TaxID=1436965 RepID=A0ABS4KCU9_9FIRM|nr:NUDIX hydrolase [Peptoniphilus stercorisuis]MBP2024991.1 ADP-ribose pyrophosphatase [Peptoniphilus stercorisuis]
MEQIERTMKSEKVFDGKILSLRVDTVELPDKKYSKREVVEHDPAVAVVAADEDNNILLVKQYRKPVEKSLLEIPAGSLEIGENPKEGALRELKEETGYIAKDLEYITEFYSTPGFCTEKMYIFFADEIEESSQDLDEDEFIECIKVPLDKAVKMIEVGEIMDAKTIVGILMYKRLRGDK